MKNVLFVFIILFPFLPLRSQVVAEVSIQNQKVEGTDLFFDIYLRTTTGTSGDLFLAGSDFVLTYNDQFFSSPSITLVDGTTVFTAINAANAALVSLLYSSNTSPRIDGLSGNIIINLNGVDPGNQTAFESFVAKIDGTESLHRLGTFRLSGISNPNGTAGLKWKTSGSGVNTRVFTYDENDVDENPYQSYEIELAAIDPQDIALPVELIDFEALPESRRHARLRWRTASESNSSHFLVERSNDGYSWEPVGEVKAAGNSILEQGYSFLDENVYDPAAGPALFYYRLRMVDLNETFEYSRVRSVAFEGNAPIQAVRVYPNPVGRQEGLSVELLGLTTEVPVHFRLFDTAGRLILQRKLGDGKDQQFSLSLPDSLPAAVYWMELYGGDQVFDRRPIVLVD